MRSKNYLPYSNMKNSVMVDLYSVDFNNRKKVNILGDKIINFNEAYKLFYKRDVN